MPARPAPVHAFDAPPIPEAYSFLMTLRRLLVLPLLLMAALLVGCGSDDSDSNDSGTSTERGSKGDSSDDQKDEDRDDAVGTDDFSFITPDGWEDISDEVSGAEIAYRDDEPVNGFAANVNVIRTSGPKMSVEDLEEAGIAELEAGGFQDVAADDPYEVDGEESPVVTSLATQEGVTYQTRQYYAQYDGAYYIITFSFSPDVDDAEVVDVSESIIDSWRWES